MWGGTGNKRGLLRLSEGSRSVGSGLVDAEKMPSGGLQERAPPSQSP